MLKISTEGGAGATRLRLEGKLSGPWVDALEQTWYAARADNEGTRIVVDLSKVTFIDAEGRKLLGWMFQQGAGFQASGCMIKCIVEEITGNLEGCPPRSAH